MDEICAFAAKTFTRQSGGQPRNVQGRYAVAVKKDGNTIGHLPRFFSRVCSLSLLEQCHTAVAARVLRGVLRISHRDGLSCKYGPRFVD